MEDIDASTTKRKPESTDDTDSDSDASSSGKEADKAKAGKKSDKDETRSSITLSGLLNAIVSCIGDCQSRQAR